MSEIICLGCDGPFDSEDPAHYKGYCCEECHDEPDPLVVKYNKWKARCLAAEAVIVDEAEGLQGPNFMIWYNLKQEMKE